MKDQIKKEDQVHKKYNSRQIESETELNAR